MYMLNSFVKKIEGNNGCILINTENSQVLDLNNKEALLLDSLLYNAYQPLDEVFVQTLIDNKWLVEVLYPSKVEKLDFLNMELKGLTDFKLNKIIIELSTSCSLDCIYCEKDNENAFASCTCKRWNYNAIEINYNTLIDQFLPFEIEKILVIGGDPFFDSYDKLMELLTQLKEKGYKGEVVIYTNGSQITKDKIKFLRNFSNVRINILLLGCNEEDYNYITKKSKVFKKVIENIKSLKNNGISVNGTLLLCDAIIPNVANSTLQLLQINIGIKYVFHETFTNKEILNSNENRMIKSDYYSYQILEQTNCCLFSQIFISSELKVYPCPYLREFLLGEISEEKELFQIFQDDKYREFWFLSKSKIKNCNVCKYRLQCMDCRAVEYAVTKDLYEEYFCNISKELVFKSEGNI